MDIISSAVRAELLRVLSAVYRRTEHGKAPTEEFCSGHDRAVVRVAEGLGFTQPELFRAADQDREKEG